MNALKIVAAVVVVNVIVYMMIVEAGRPSYDPKPDYIELGE